MSEHAFPQLQPVTPDWKCVDFPDPQCWKFFQYVKGMAEVRLTLDMCTQAACWRQQGSGKTVEQQLCGGQQSIHKPEQLLQRPLFLQ